LLQGLKSFIARIRRRSTPRLGRSISLRDGGFLVHPTGQPVEKASVLKWQEITQITAFKRDCFSYDLICLLIGGALTIVEINEEDAGWDAFLQAAQENLPGLVPTNIWWIEVMQPAFATNPTTIYRNINHLAS
jgi:hypothetical protein